MTAHDETSAPRTMGTQRLEAFSDGVIAIIITIMVLELRVPHDALHAPTFGDLRGLVPVLLSYVLSFVYLGIYWNNHHHMLHVTRRVDGGILWANLHLLFWLSLVPFVTAWMGENDFATIPVFAYGVVLMMNGLAYWILQSTILRREGPHSVLAEALGRDLKGRSSPVLYISALPLTFVNRWIPCAIYVITALIWLVPDPRIERALARRRAVTHEVEA